MTPPRIIVPGATTAVTRRCAMRKAFLAPWHPLVSQIWLYSLALAQRNTKVAVHFGVQVLNHHHIDVTPRSNNLPEFVGQLNSNLSRGICALLTRERYDAPVGGIFDNREPHYMRLLDAGAQATQLIYHRLNCSAAGLVARPEHMPGTLLDPKLWKKGYIDVPRPPVFFHGPEVLRLYLTPQPLLYEAFNGDLDRLLYHLDKLTEEGLRAIRAARGARPVKGAKAVSRIHPWSEPATLAESGGKPKPSFRIGTRGIVGRQANIEAALETRAFRKENNRVRLARIEGSGEPFPYGTYAQVVRHGAPMNPASDIGNLVTQPGPLLEDIQTQLAYSDTLSEQRHAASIELCEDIRQAFNEEAADICEDSEIDFTQRTVVVGATGPEPSTENDSPERDTVIVERRRSKKRRSRPQAARRIVVLRDRRLGRPPSSGRSGSDPPS